jgi:hypothetical protein
MVLKPHLYYNLPRCGGGGSSNHLLYFRLCSVSVSVFPSFAPVLKFPFSVSEEKVKTRIRRLTGESALSR